MPLLRRDRESRHRRDADEHVVCGDLTAYRGRQVYVADADRPPYVLGVSAREPPAHSRPVAREPD